MLSIELQIYDDAPTKLYINNQSSMKLVKNLVLHAKTNVCVCVCVCVCA